MEIDEWDEDEDILELGGDLDEDTIIAKVKQSFITNKAKAAFMSALNQCMWERDHQAGHTSPTRTCIAAGSVQSCTLPCVLP